MDNPMLHSRQPYGLGLLGILLALSLVHVIPPAQAGESGSETAVRSIEQAAQGPLGIAPLNDGDDGDDDGGDHGDDPMGTTMATTMGTTTATTMGHHHRRAPPPPPPPPLPPPAPPSAPAPSAPDADTAPLGLSNPQPFGCELAGDEIVCEETGTTLPFIRFDVDIPENAGFLEFDYTFTGADRAVSDAEGIDTPGRSDGEGRPRASIGDLGAVFIVNVPIAALPASGVLQEGVFQNSGQSGLPRSRRSTMFIANFPSGAAGSVFRVRNLRVDRCTQKCFRKRATLCGTDGRDELTGTRRSDVIVGRRGNDTVKGLGGNDSSAGAKAKTGSRAGRDATAWTVG